MNDTSLVRQAQAGHVDAYNQLVQRWATCVVALCQGVIGRTDLAEQLTQETFVRGFENLSSLDVPERFGPWLTDLAVRTCREWVGPLPATDEPTQPNDPLLQAALSLPEEERMVLLLFCCEQTSYWKIATLLGVSTATVSARLAQARFRLRAALTG